SSVLFLAETNLTEERPSHTRTHESPGNDAEAHNLTTQTGEDSNFLVGWCAMGESPYAHIERKLQECRIVP
ncbi:hypothetical protein JS533_006405, partial [Bifidobacterium amazonense]